MIEFGQTLRKAREAKGLTQRQIANTTHLMLQIIDDLENEKFSKIAAPIYGRGYVKIYCEVLGIEPAPLLDKFMELYTGVSKESCELPPNEASPITENATPISEAPSPTKTEEPIPPPSIPSPSIPPPVTDFFKLEEQVVTQPKPRIDTAEPKRYIPPPPTSPSRYAAPLPIEEVKPFFSRVKISIPPTAWRLLALACAAGLILWLLGFCVKALYNATMTPKEDAPTVETSSEMPARKPQVIQPLYID